MFTGCEKNIFTVIINISAIQLIARPPILAEYMFERENNIEVVSRFIIPKQKRPSSSIIKCRRSAGDRVCRRRSQTPRTTRVLGGVHFVARNTSNVRRIRRGHNRTAGPDTDSVTFTLAPEWCGRVAMVRERGDHHTGTLTDIRGA